MTQLTVRLVLTLLICITPAIAAPAPGPGIKRIPPAGVTISPNDRKELETGTTELGKRIDALRESLQGKTTLLELLPDVQIYHNAVRYALKYDEFFKANEVGAARTLLKEGNERARELGEGKAPWTKAAGLIVRGYISKIDGSVQPYGLVVPSGFDTDPDHPRRLDVWYHGRGETLNEISFISGREKSLGEFTPADAFVLHPYGRYCNANRFAGEVDTFEALENVRKHYAVDPNRLVDRGFSMGGAACWMFATHHPSLWAAAAPGAGFTETPHFLKIEDVNTIPWYQRKLWHMYDSIDYAVNLFNCPTVAYSGEADPQKQAADEMDKAMAAVGLHLEHLIGPDKTKHAYHPKTKLEVARRVDELAAKGRDPVPAHLKFTTWTLKYNQSFWLTVDGLEHHWDRANLEAAIVSPTEIKLSTSNTTGVTLAFAAGACPLDASKSARVIIDSQELSGPKIPAGEPWEAHFQKVDGKWSMIKAVDDGSLYKRHNLQGPVDDAFMDSFIFVKPTGKALSQQTAGWVASELAHATSQWRSVFRGEARVKDDIAIDERDIVTSNLVLWGDPSSNAVLKKIADKLPIKWNGKSLELAGKTYSASSHLPILIFPNPLNPKRYVVLNSGHTFREIDLTNNDRQNSKLPDWAVVDTATPPSGESAGAIVDAGFFGERWEFDNRDSSKKQ